MMLKQTLLYRGPLPYQKDNQQTLLSNHKYFSYTGYHMQVVLVFIHCSAVFIPVGVLIQFPTSFRNWNPIIR